MQNPILQRELKCALRKGRPFLLMLAYVAVLAAVIAFTYPAGQKIDLKASTIGREIFIAFSVAQLLMVLLVTPAVAVASLAVEREKGALESLLVTPTSQWEIVVGKFLASLFHVTLLVTASLPLTAVAFMLGGVSPEELVASYVTIFAVAGVCAAVGILFIAAHQSPLAAVANAYLSLPIYLAGLAVLCIIGKMGGALLFFESVLAFSYLTALRQATRTASYFGMGVCCFSFVPLVVGYQSSLATEWYLALVVAAAAGALVLGCLASAAKRLQYAGAQESRSALLVVGTRMRAAGNPKRAALRLIPDRLNPVFVLEWRRKCKWLLRPAVGVAAILAVAAASNFIWSSGSPHEVLTQVAQTHLLLVMTIGAVLGALMVAPEVEGRTIQHLCMAPLSSRQIVLGKFCAALCCGVALVGACLPWLVEAVLLRMATITNAFLCFLTEVLSVVISVMVGMLFSVLIARTRAAIAFSLTPVLAIAGHYMFDSWFWDSRSALYFGWSSTTDRYPNPLRMIQWDLWVDYIHRFLPKLDFAIRYRWQAQLLFELVAIAGILAAVTLFLFHRRRSRWS